MDEQPQQLDMFIDVPPEEVAALEAENELLRAEIDYWRKLCDSHEQQMIELENACIDEFGISPQQMIDD